MADALRLPPTVRLSDKAARGLNGVPEEDCPKHVNTVFEEIPEKLRYLFVPPGTSTELARQQRYGCAECFVEFKATLAAEQEKARVARAQERELRRADKAAVKRDAEAAQAGLKAAVAVARAQVDEIRRTNETQAAIRETAQQEVAGLMREVVELEEQMRALRARQQATKAKLEEAKTRVSFAVTDADVAKVETAVAADLQLAIDDFNDAWQAANPAFRKARMDRKLLHAARELREKLAPSPAPTT